MKEVDLSFITVRELQATWTEWGRNTVIVLSKRGRSISLSNKISTSYSHLLKIGSVASCLLTATERQ